MLFRSHALLIVLGASAVILAGCSSQPKPSPVAAAPVLPPAPPPPVMPTPVVMDGRQQQAQADSPVDTGASSDAPSSPDYRAYAQAMNNFKRDEAPDVLITWPYGDQDTMRLETTPKFFFSCLPGLRSRAYDDGSTIYDESNKADAELAKSMALAFVGKRLGAGFSPSQAARCHLVFRNMETGTTADVTPDMSGV